jgi:acyl transferase domain-containing protein/acyl carrier protein
MDKKNGRPGERSGREIAVIGLAGRFPGAGSIEQFWANLKNGVESISRFTDAELLKEGIGPEVLADPNYIKAKGVLADADCFDADFFSYPPREAERMDPQIRVLHECAWEALERSGYNPDEYPGLIGAFFGANENLEWMERIQALDRQAADGFDRFLLNFRDYVATRISYKLNLKGPSFTLLSACSTSLVAVHQACRALRAGECGLAIAGGTSVTLPFKSGYLYQEGLMMSSDGHCRTFDAKADGTVFGDGVGVVVLKQLKTALRDRDHIHAVIKGSAVNNDGNGKSCFTAPSANGQERVIRAALKEAGVRPDSVSFVEAHGTGTRVGDPIEVQALKSAFGTRTKGFCALGSVKTNIGHVNIAAGISSFIKSALALESALIPPTLHFEHPNPDLGIESGPFLVNSEPIVWKKNGGPRRAGVSAFGFGGTNAHCILEEPPRRKSAQSLRRSQLIVLSAKTESALAEESSRLAARFRSEPSVSLADASFTLGRGRKAFPFRRAVVASDLAGAAEALEKVPRSAPPCPRSPSVVFMFPGQGSQAVGMGAVLYRQEPVFKETFDLCASILKNRAKLDIREALYPRRVNKDKAQTRLTDTGIAQPTIFSVSYSLARLLISWGLKPSAVIGHSLGEFVAACVAGVFTLEDALHLVAQRGLLMRQLKPGRMLAVPLGEKETSVWLNAELSLAAVNGPSLCVVSGAAGPVEDLKKRLQKKRIASQYLATSHPFHSKLMDPVLAPFARICRGIDRQAPGIPFLSTVTAGWADPAEITTPEYWTRNLRQTVRFSAAITKLLEDPSMVFLEVGPGRVLGGLARTHFKPNSGRLALSTMPVESDALDEEAFLLTTLGTLWLNGLSVDWTEFYRHERRSRVPLPTYPFERRRFRAALTARRPAEGISWTQLVKKPDVAEWFAVPSWKRTASTYLDTNGSRPRLRWLIFRDADGLGSELAERLRAMGQDSVSIYAGDRFERRDDDAFTINPGLRSDYENVFDILTAEGRLPQMILHLWTVTSGATGRIPVETAAAFQDLGFFSLLYLAQAVGTHNITDEIRLAVVSNGLHQVTGEEAIAAEKAAVLGLVKVIPQEYPNIACCSIDILRPDRPGNSGLDPIEQILTETVTNQGEPVVAFRGNHRWVQIFERVRLDAGLSKSEWVRSEGVYLITGGLGGIGLVFAGFLAQKGRAKLILTGRTALPPRGEWDAWLAVHEASEPQSHKIRAIRAMEEAGAEVLTSAVDVADRDGMVRLVAEARERWGAIHGVIHAAGISGEGIIQLKKADVARGILVPKILGTLILEEIFAGTKLDFLLLCSSIASVLGGIGLSDYCAANAFLDAFPARRDPAVDGPCISVNWDMWGEVGMGLKTKMPDELQGWLEKELRDGLTSAEGVDVLQRIMTWGKSSNVIVSTRDLQARIDLWIKREFIKEKESLMEEEGAASPYLRPDLTAEYQPPETPAERKVADVWAKLFGIEKVGRRDNFYELGGHSLLATTLANKLKRQFETNLSIRDIMEHPTVLDLARLIESSAGSKS